MKKPARHLQFTTVLWRGVQARRARIYHGGPRGEFFPVNCRRGDPWCVSMTFIVSWKGRRNFRTRGFKPRHVRRMGWA